MIRIDFEDTILPHYVSHDLMDFRFNAPQRDGSVIELIVQIRDIDDPLLPDVFNIGFGPADSSGSFRDDIPLAHKSPSTIFSTVMLLAVAYLERNPSHFIGIDGSDDRRASLYHRMFRYNGTSLGKNLILTGVDWYIRLLRNGDVERDASGSPFFKPRPEAFDLNRKANDLYRYYLVNLNY